MARRVAICTLLALLTLFVYWGVWRYDFVNFDDPEYVTDNPHVATGLTWNNIGWAMTSSYAANWFPLTWLSLMVDASVWGSENAGGFHLTNLVLHIANTLLLFLLLEKWTGAIWRSAVVAALFAVHPLHVESVAWVTERKDVLSTFFGLLCLAAYSRFATCNCPGWYMAALSLFAASLMSKQMFVTLPVLLLLLDYWPLRRWKRTPENEERLGGSLALPGFRRLILEKIPFGVLAIAATVIVVLVQHKGGTVQSLSQIDLDTRLYNAVAASALYLAKTFWPIDLAVFYPYPPTSVLVRQALIGAAVLVATSIFVFFNSRRRPYLAFGWWWYLITLLPVIGIVQVGSQRMADRYTYVPLIGIFVALVWLVVDVLPPVLRKSLVPAGAIAVIAVLAIMTHRQATYWRDSVSLFEHAIAVTENNAMAHTNLGLAYGNAGNKDDAIEQFNLALVAEPDNAIAHNNLGVELLAKNDRDGAQGHFRRAVEIDPKYVTAINNLAGLLFERKQFNEAEDQYRRAVFLAPENPRVLIGFSELLRATNRHADAAWYLETACRGAPDNAQAHMNLGMTLYELRRIDEGLQHLERAVELDPDSATAHLNYGVALFGKNRLNEAIDQFREALRIKPGFEAAQKGLDVAIAQQNKAESVKRP